MISVILNFSCFYYYIFLLKKFQKVPESIKKKIKYKCPHFPVNILVNFLAGFFPPLMQFLESPLARLLWYLDESLVRGLSPGESTQSSKIHGRYYGYLYGHCKKLESCCFITSPFDLPAYLECFLICLIFFKSMTISAQPSIYECGLFGQFLSLNI